MYAQMAFSREIPGLLEAELGGNSRVRGKDVEFFDVERANWRRVMEVLSNEGIAPAGGLVVVDQGGSDWSTHESDVVAGVLDADLALPPANPAEDYEPKLEPPAVGHLRDEASLLVAEKPQGDAAFVGEELVVSTRLFEWLALRSEFVRGGSVAYTRSELKGWKRLFIDARCSVVHEGSLAPAQPCVRSGEPYRPFIGLWMARPESEGPGEQVARDVLGYGYHDTVTPFLLASDTALEGSREFWKGLRLRKVYGFDSPKARIVRDLRAAAWTSGG